MHFWSRNSGKESQHSQPWGDLCVDLTNMKHGCKRVLAASFSPKAENPCFVLQSTPSSFKSSAPKLHLKLCLSEASYRSFLSLKSWYTEILPPLFYTAANWVGHFSSSSLRWILRTSSPNHKTSLQGSLAKTIQAWLQILLGCSLRMSRTQLPACGPRRTLKASFNYSMWNEKSLITLSEKSVPKTTTKLTIKEH